MLRSAFRRLSVLLAGICSLAVAGDSFGQYTPASEIGSAADFVVWSTAVEEDTTTAEHRRVNLLLSVTIGEDWKMYAMDSPRPSRGVTIDLESLPEGVVEAGMPRQSQPKRDHDQNFDMEVTYFQEKGAFTIPLALGTSVDEADSIRGTVTYQICSDSRGLCLPPTPAEFVVPVSEAVGCLSDPRDTTGECEVGPLELGDVPAAPGPISDDQPGRGIGSAHPVTGGRWAGFLLLALAAGFGALLTPCVFPMIPLTVSYFTKHAAERRRAVGMASLFGGAIVVTFTLLGMVMAVVAGAAGALTIAANPWVNLFIALVLIGFGLSLIGFYDLRVPNSWANAVNRRAGGKGFGGVIFMALTLTLVSFSCTAPFVGGLLAAASAGSWLRPIAGMAVFSGAFASPFVLLAVFPGLLESMPRSGAWMNAVKVTLGFVEIAAAIKFLSNADLVWGLNVISRPLAIALTVVIFALTAMYLFGRIRVPSDARAAPVRVGVGRAVFGVAFLAFAIYLVPGILGAQRTAFDPYFPPRRATDIALLAPDRHAVDADDGWIVDDRDAAFELALTSARPVFIDFTGYSCTNCRQMENSVFPAPPVADRLKRDFVRLKLYTDGLERGPDSQKYQLQLTGTVALPTYAIVEPASGRLVSRASGTMSAARMAAFLGEGVDRYAARLELR